MHPYDTEHDGKAVMFARYGLVEAEAKGEPVADDVGFDAAGNVTTDPAEIRQGGAIRNFTRYDLCLKAWSQC